MSDNYEASIKRFNTDYATSGRSKCKKCKKFICQNELRIGFRNHSTKFDGMIDNWFHFGCIIATRNKPEKLEDISNLYMIKYEDQVKLIDRMHLGIDLTSQEEKEIKAQNEEFFGFRGKLEGISTEVLQEFLRLNNYADQRGIPLRQNRVAEFLTFGATKKCMKCNRGNLIYQNNIYQCWCEGYGGIRCMNKIDTPERQLCRIPKSLQSVFYDYAPRVKDRKLRSFVVNNADVFERTRSISNNYSQPPEKRQRVVIKNSTAIDSNLSQFSEPTQIHKSDNGFAYCCTLIKLDLQLNKNSFYRMKVLKSDASNKAYLLEEYGRTGMKRDFPAKPFENVLDACRKFEKKFYEMTENKWEGRKTYIRRPKKYVYLNVDYNEEEVVKNVTADLSVDELDSEVCKVVKLMFNKDIVEQALVEFDIDMNLMPHGMLAEENLRSAEEILNKIYFKLEKGVSGVENFIKDSEDFYYLIPHCFGFSCPQIISSIEIIAKKWESMQVIRTLELSYNFRLQTENLIMNSYNYLDTIITPIDQSSDMFVLINDYATDTQYDNETSDPFIVENIFEIERAEDENRFKPHENSENRYLLWHGSRVVNFPSILKNGLKISPPDNVHLSGKMFGNGVYFADMISKSGNYSKPKRKDQSGLLILCEVALGAMHEMTSALGSRFMGKDLPERFDSVKGVGKTYPEGQKTLENGCIIPMGPMAFDEDIQTVLRHNEYIIYDESRCKMKYLVSVKFTNNQD